MTKREIIELYLADLNNLVANSDAKRSRIIELENELEISNQNNMKETAVYWLVEKFNQCEPMYSGIQSLEHKHYLDNLIEQANEMFKEQIMDAWNVGIDSFSTLSAEQYYNETFK